MLEETWSPLHAVHADYTAELTQRDERKHQREIAHSMPQHQNSPHCQISGSLSFGTWRIFPECQHSMGFMQHWILARLRFHSSMETFCFGEPRKPSRWSQTVGMEKGVVVQAVWSRHWRGASTPLLCCKSGIKVLCIWHRLFHSLQIKSGRGLAKGWNRRGTAGPKEQYVTDVRLSQGCCSQIGGGFCATFEVGPKPPRQDKHHQVGKKETSFCSLQ